MESAIAGLRHPLGDHQRSAAAGTVMLVERLSRYPPIGGFKGGVFVTPSMCRSSSIKVLLWTRMIGPLIYPASKFQVA